MSSNYSGPVNKLRQQHSLKQRQSFKQLTRIGFCAAILFGIGLSLYLDMGRSEKAFAYSNGDYRSKQSGSWTTAANWEKYNSVTSTWSVAGSSPTSSSPAIYIQPGHTMTISGIVSVDEVVINSTGIIDITSTGVLTVANGAGTDLNVSGILKNAGSIISTGATIVFQNGGKYQNNFSSTPGTIPTATWNTGSTCEIIGYTSNQTAPSGLGQAFSNFIWNCVSQNKDINLGGALNNITGDLTVTTTGSKTLQLASGTATITVAGDFYMTAGSVMGTTSNNSNPIFNLTGNYIQTGGTFSLVDGNNSIGTFNIGGNWSLTSTGIFTVGGNSSTSETVIFNKTGTQTVTSGGTISGNIDITINSGSVLSLGTNIIKGRNFTLSSGAGIILGSTAGITSAGPTGNVQSSISRTFNTGADYTYNGTSSQVTGNALPTSIRKLTISNAANVTLTNNVSVSSIITFTTGKVITGSNELISTNSASAGVTGTSSSNYVVGNLRRAVTGTGTYIYPVGSLLKYEQLSVTLNSTSGFSTLAVGFINANPVNPSYPLTGVVSSEAKIDSMLNYGYWTLSANGSLAGGTYDVKAAMTGYTNTISPAYFYPVLMRTNYTSAWNTCGSDQAFKYSSGTLTGNKTGLSSFGDLGIGFGVGPPILSFDNHTLISGTDMQVGAVYLVTDVAMGLDAWIEVLDFTGGASISDVDNWAGNNGYDDAWQPFINIASNSTCSVGWKVTFKVAGTSIDSIVPNVVFAAIDVDGDGVAAKEFVTAYNPSSISYSSGSQLIITRSGNDFTATAGSYNTVAAIDTNHAEAMFKVNYKNVKTFNYRTGVKTTGGAQVRQASLYFKSFFSLPVTVLPIKLLYFNANLKEGVVNLNWSTAEEKENDFFTIERSEDGKEFEKVLTKKGAGNSYHTLTYSANDNNPLKGYSYYRLKQTDFDGHSTYSQIVSIKNGGLKTSDVVSLDLKSIAPNPFTQNFNMNFILKKAAEVNFTLMNSTGQTVARDKIECTDGYNTYEFMDKQNLSKGIYFVNLEFEGQKITKKIVKN